MGRVYTAESDFSVSAAQSLMTIQAAATHVIKLLKVHVAADGDDTNEQMSIEIAKITTYGTPAGTSVTPEAYEDLDSASAATVLVNLSGEPTAYNAVAIDAGGATSLIGYNYEARQTKEPVIAPSGAVGIRLIEAQGTTKDLRVSVTWEEIG